MEQIHIGGHRLCKQMGGSQRVEDKHCNNNNKILVWVHSYQVFGVCQSGYVEDPKGHVIKMLVEELLFNHDIKPLYIYTNKWNINKCKIPINIRYLADTSVVY